MNINTCRVSELKKQNIYRTFIGLDYRDVSLVTLYLVVIGINIFKN